MRKNFCLDLVAVFFVVMITALFHGSASAAVSCMDTPKCTTPIDGGKSARICSDSITTQCLCEELSCHKSKIAKQCPTGWENMGTTVTGEKCCHDMKSQCETTAKKALPKYIPQTVPPMYTAEEDMKSATNQEVYYGVFDKQNRSPEEGRKTALVAKLDVCFGSATMDSLNRMSMDNYGRFRSCQDFCKQSNVNKNCRINNSETCLDRCACMYGQGYESCRGL